MKLKNETTTQYVSPETGEIITQTISKTYSIKSTPESFAFQFFHLLQNYIDLSDTGKNVLAVLCSQMEYKTNCVKMNSSTRKLICKMCNIKYQSLANALQYLKKKGLIKITDGDCMINPEYFWKGTLQSREDFLKTGKLTVNLEFEG